MNTNIPLVTAIFLSFNHQKYLKESLMSLLNQDYSNLEIIISDDNSTDDSYELIKSIIDLDDKRILIRKNEVNLGIAGHINTLMELAKGELTVVFAGDDISVPHRISKLVDFWIANDKPSSIFSSVWEINEEGMSVGVREPVSSQFNRPKKEVVYDLINRKIGLLGCSHAWRSDLFEQFGGISLNIINEDRIIPFRSALSHGIRHIPEKLVYYRVTSGISSISRETRKDQLFKYNKTNAIRELNDIEQNLADAHLFYKESIPVIQARKAEVKLLFRFSHDDFSVLNILKALYQRAKPIRVLKICLRYLGYYISRIFYKENKNA